MKTSRAINALNTACHIWYNFFALDSRCREETHGRAKFTKSLYRRIFFLRKINPTISRRTRSPFLLRQNPAIAEERTTERFSSLRPRTTESQCEKTENFKRAPSERFTSRSFTRYWLRLRTVIHTRSLPL